MKSPNKVFSLANLRKFFIINVGVFIVSIALHFFLVPDELAVGGSTGLAILISSAFPNISMSGILLVINSILLVIGLFALGKVFGVYTIYSTFATSFFLKLLEVFYPMNGPLTDDIFIDLFFGILIRSIGLAFVLNEGASTGGTDIIGMIVKKYTNFSIGAGLAFSDGLITLGALIIYGPKIGMYSLFGVFMNSVMVDKILAGFDSKFSLTISSDKIEEINDFILNDIERGSTIYNAEGGYSHDNRIILTTVVSRKDYIRLKNYVAEIDQSAFVYVSQVNEVSGIGFTLEK